MYHTLCITSCKPCCKSWVFKSSINHGRLRWNDGLNISWTREALHLSLKFLASACHSCQLSLHCQARQQIPSSRRRPRLWKIGWSFFTRARVTQGSDHLGRNLWPTNFACLLCLRLNHAEVNSYTQIVHQILQSSSIPLPSSGCDAWNNLQRFYNHYQKSNKNQQKFLFGRIFRGKSLQTQTKTSPLACFLFFFGWKLRFLMHFHARGRCLDPHGQRSQYHRGAAKGGGGQVKLEKMLPTEVIVYACLLYQFWGVQRFEFQFLGCWKGMFIPCLYHVYSVAPWPQFFDLKALGPWKIDARLVKCGCPPADAGVSRSWARGFVALLAVK